MSVFLNKMKVLDLIFPRNCLQCRAQGSYICPNCFKKVGKGHIEQESISLWNYEGVIRKAILALKYHFISDITDELTTYASEKIKSDYSNLNGVLVPIPLSATRMRWRGFNQASELGIRISKLMKWDFDDKIISKTRDTQVQAHLEKSARLTNLKNAFTVHRNISKNIILFDDVRTTGTTLNEAKKTLLKNGAKKVFCLTIASTGRNVI